MSNSGNNESENKDRLSDLPDCVIIHILLFLNIKQAVGTCVLSTRWKDMWKHLPALILHNSDFRTIKIFTKCVSKVLSLRDSSISLKSLNFERYNCRFEPQILKTVVNYAISHHVQHLGLHVNGDIAQIPPTMFSCETLTHLKLSIHNGIGHETLFPKSLNLPALTSLQLGNFTFCVGDNDCAEPFSIINRLNNLLICDCTVKGTEALCISSATLVNLTIYNNINSTDYYKIELRTPSLCTFAFCGTPYQSISGSNVSSLKHVDIHAEAEVDSYSLGPPMFLFSWLLEFANIESLTVTATTLQVLSLFPGMFKLNFPSLGNLKSLRVEFDEFQYEFRMLLCKVKLLTVESAKETARIRKAFELGLEPSPPIPVGMVDFLLQNSLRAEVDYIDCTKKPLRPRRL